MIGSVLWVYGGYIKDAINKNTVNEKHHKKDTMRVFFYMINICERMSILAINHAVLI